MATNDKDDALITESTVDLFERTRRERGQPASPESQRVGLLSELIETLLSAAPGFRAAAARASDPRLAQQLEQTADDYDALAHGASARVRELGGAPPTEGNSDRLPADARDVDYAQDDAALVTWAARNRARVDELRERVGLS